MGGLFSRQKQKIKIKSSKISFVFWNCCKEFEKLLGNSFLCSQTISTPMLGSLSDEKINPQWAGPFFSAKTKNKNKIFKNKLCFLELLQRIREIIGKQLSLLTNHFNTYAWITL